MRSASSSQCVQSRQPRRWWAAAWCRQHPLIWRALLCMHTPPLQRPPAPHVRERLQHAASGLSTNRQQALPGCCACCLFDLESDAACWSLSHTCALIHPQARRLALFPGNTNHTWAPCCAAACSARHTHAHRPPRSAPTHPPPRPRRPTPPTPRSCWAPSSHTRACATSVTCCLACSPRSCCPRPTCTGRTCGGWRRWQAACSAPRRSWRGGARHCWCVRVLVCLRACAWLRVLRACARLVQCAPTEQCVNQATLWY